MRSLLKLPVLCMLGFSPCSFWDPKYNFTKHAPSPPFSPIQVHKPPLFSLLTVPFFIPVQMCLMKAVESSPRSPDQTRAFPPPTHAAATLPLFLENPTRVQLLQSDSGLLLCSPESTDFFLLPCPRPPDTPISQRWFFFFDFFPVATFLPQFDFHAPHERSPTLPLIDR